jgi:hypothetical protein
MEVLHNDRRPSRIVTREALENAIASVVATGGSTNAVLHLLASPTKPAYRSRSTTSIESAPACRSSRISSRADDSSPPTCTRRAARGCWQSG